MTETAAIRTEGLTKHFGEKVAVHFLGEPTQTRHLFVHNEQAALSPAWSIHAGCGTGNSGQ